MGASISPDRGAGQGDLAFKNFKTGVLRELDWALRDLSTAIVNFLDAEGSKFVEERSIRCRGFVDEIMIDDGTLVDLLHFQNSAGLTAARLRVRTLQADIKYDFMYDPQGALAKDYLEDNEIPAAGSYALKTAGHNVVAASGIGDPIGTKELGDAAVYFAKLLQAMTPKAQAAPAPALDTASFGGTVIEER